MLGIFFQMVPQGRIERPSNDYKSIVLAIVLQGQLMVRTTGIEPVTSSL